MAQLDNITKIIAEEFKKDDRETVQKLAETLNPFMEQVYQSYQKNINFSNLNMDLVRVVVKVNSSGVPLSVTKFSSNLRRIEGNIVINALNKSFSGVYPSGGMFVTCEQNANGLYTVKSVTGIQANNEYQLTLMLIGSDN